MNQEKYIGMDVHQATISVAIMDSSGKLMVESILETKAATILEFIQGLRGSLSVTFEEGTSAAWLHDLLKPHITHLDPNGRGAHGRSLVPLVKTRDFGDDAGKDKSGKGFKLHHDRTINKTAGGEIWGIIKTCLISWNTLPAFVRKSRIYGT